jgi:hypothetical protein
METFEITKQDNRYDARPLLNYLAEAKNGTYRVEITRVLSKRTNAQNRYLWKIVYPILRAGLNAEGWDFSDDEELHEYLKMLYAGKKVLNVVTGEYVVLPGSTRKMDTAQFSAYIDKLKEVAECVHVTIPDPITT